MEEMFKMAKLQREIDAQLRVIFFRKLTETGGWKAFKARLKLAKEPDAQRQEYLDTCAQLGVEAAGIDIAIE